MGSVNNKYNTLYEKSIAHWELKPRSVMNASKLYTDRRLKSSFILFLKMIRFGTFFKYSLNKKIIFISYAFI